PRACLDRDRGAGVRGDPRAGVGAVRARLEPLVRRRLGGDGPVRGVSLRARRGACTPRALGAPAGSSRALRDARSAHARRGPARGAGALPAALAAPVAGAPLAAARGLMEPDAARRELLALPGRGRLEPGVLAAGHPLPAYAPAPVVPRRGGRHRRALGGGLPSGGADPARPRVVPAGRLPRERPAVREVRAARVRRVAAPARRALRRADGRAPGLQRAGG